MTMRTFVLHDGEDDIKNTALDEFLTPLKAAGGDWEGDNSGVTLWMPHVSVGDVILSDYDGLGFRVLKKGEPVKITRYMFHFVHRAMLMIEHDNGAHHVNRICGPGTVDLDTFTMPFDYGIDRLLVAEMALMWLSEQPTKIAVGDAREAVDMEQPLEDFVCGDMDAQEDYIKKHSEEQPGLRTAHDLINDWFNGWEGPYTWQQATGGDAT